jgi:hypothetical protein
MKSGSCLLAHARFEAFRRTHRIGHRAQSCGSLVAHGSRWEPKPLHRCDGLIQQAIESGRLRHRRVVMKIAGRELGGCPRKQNCQCVSQLVASGRTIKRLQRRLRSTGVQVRERRHGGRSRRMRDRAQQLSAIRCDESLTPEGKRRCVAIGRDSHRRCRGSGGSGATGPQIRTPAPPLPAALSCS